MTVFDGYNDCSWVLTGTNPQKGAFVSKWGDVFLKEIMFTADNADMNHVILCLSHLFLFQSNTNR